MSHRLFIWLKRNLIYSSFFLLTVLLAGGCKEVNKQKSLYEYSDVRSRWSSPENRNGIAGNGGRENNRAKGHPYDSIPAGKSLDLLNISGTGLINRIWITIDNRTPEMLRALRIDMYWDDESKPAVSVPFGDFFGVGLGRMTAFQNVFFANPEGRSFNCFIPMPFRKGAKIVIRNESGIDIRKIFYDVDYSLLKEWNEDFLYFHACWRRDTATVPGIDFDLLPKIAGRGRYLGVNIGVSANSLYERSWFGEGEIKMYLDEDGDYPTLNGTGTEDYIGSAWGQGKFINEYTGCTIADDSLLQWAFYRFHVPDPVYFRKGCRVSLQQIGGNMTASVEGYQKNKAPLIPVSIDTGAMVPYYKDQHSIQLDSLRDPRGWTNFYRSDDLSATSYFFLDSPTDELPVLQNVMIRTCNLRAKPQVPKR
jgi:Protein of unknown function (DUF2961)